MQESNYSKQSIEEIILIILSVFSFFSNIKEGKILLLQFNYDSTIHDKNN